MLCACADRVSRYLALTHRVRQNIHEWLWHRSIHGDTKCEFTSLYREYDLGAFHPLYVCVVVCYQRTITFALEGVRGHGRAKKNERRNMCSKTASVSNRQPQCQRE